MIVNVTGIHASEGDKKLTSEDTERGSLMDVMHGKFSLNKHGLLPLGDIYNIKQVRFYYKQVQIISLHHVLFPIYYGLIILLLLENMLVSDNPLSNVSTISAAVLLHIGTNIKSLTLIISNLRQRL